MNQWQNHTSIGLLRSLMHVFDSKVNNMPQGLQHSNFLFTVRQAPNQMLMVFYIDLPIPTKDRV